MIKFKNNDINALTSLTSLTSITNSNYGNYEYYPNINLCVFKRNNVGNGYSISLGSFPTSLKNQQYTIKWVFAYPDSSTVYTSNFNPNQYRTLSVTERTSWTSSSFTKVSGRTTINSLGVYTIQFVTPVILPYKS